MGADSMPQIGVFFSLTFVLIFRGPDVLKSNGISFDAPQFISPGPDLSIRQENLGGEVE